MSDISASAAKSHLLSGSGEVSRVSGDAVTKAQELGHKFFSSLGREAAAEAQAAGRKTLMASDLDAAAKRVLAQASPQA